MTPARAMPRRFPWVAAALLGGVLASPAAGLAQGVVVADGGGSLRIGDPVVAGVLARARPAPRTLVLSLEPLAEADAARDAFLAAGAASAETLAAPKSAAEDVAVAARIGAADIVVIVGPPGSPFADAWSGSRVEGAVRDVWRRGGTVVGSAGGAEIFGGVIRAGPVDTRDPAAPLRDGGLTQPLAPGFLNLAPTLLIETGSGPRGRHPHLGLLAARIRQTMVRRVAAAGIDPGTALLIDPDGHAQVLGEGAVTIVRLTDDSTALLETGRPPVVTDLSLTILLQGQRIDTIGWRAAGDTGGAIVADAGPASARRTPALVRGSRLTDTAVGELQVTGDDRERAWLEGGLRLIAGRVEFGGAIFQTRAYDLPAQVPNRVLGLLWGVAQRPGSLGVLLTTGSSLAIDGQGVLRVEAEVPFAGAASSVVLIDTAPAAHTGVGRVRWRDGAQGPIAAGAMWGGVEPGGARMHILAPGWAFDGAARLVIRPTAVP